MRKMLLVAQRDFLANIRRRSFLIASIGVPLLIIGLMALVVVFIIQSEEDVTSVGQVGYVDESGVLNEAIGRPGTFTAFSDTEAAETALAAGEIGAYFILPENYLQTGTVRLIVSSGYPEALNDQIDAFLIDNLADDLDPAWVERLKDPVTTSLQTLDNSRVIPEIGIIGVFLAPLLFVIIFIIATQSTSSYIMSSVVEEKSNRIMEILITSITPFQLLGGKIIGLGLVGLIQIGIWLAGIALLVRLGGSIPFLSGLSLPPDLLFFGFIYFLLNYFLNASLFAGIGAVVGAEQESRQIAGIFSLLFSLPFFFFVQFITEPDSPIVTALTLFPFSAPIAVIMRLGFGSIPAWQLVASIAILFFSTILVAWVSARVFRWSLLLYGKRPSLREVLRSVGRSGIGTTATEPNTTREAV